MSPRRARFPAAILLLAHLAGCAHLGPSDARVNDLIFVEFERVRVVTSESGVRQRVASAVGILEDARPSSAILRVHYAIGVASDTLPELRGTRLPLLAEDLSNVEVLRTPRRDDGESHTTLWLVGAGAAVLLAAAYYVIFILPLVRH